MEDRFDTDIDDLWSALTDPGRLARWMGEVEGDLRVGGEFRARFFASGWEGTGRVDACEPPQRLLLTMDPGQPDEHVIEATLAADGDGTTAAARVSGPRRQDRPGGAVNGRGFDRHFVDDVPTDRRKGRSGRGHPSKIRGRCSTWRSSGMNSS